jgi:hypothetical protein
MLKQCNEEDFDQIKSVAESRLCPERISSFFWATFMFNVFMTSVVAVAIYGSDFALEPIWFVFANTVIALFIVQFLVALFFSKLKNAYRFQRIQSVFLSILSLKMSLDMYAPFILFSEADYIPNYLRPTAFILCMGGLIYLVLSTFRGMKRVQKGELREDGNGLYNFKESKGYVSLPIIFGATFLGGAITRTLSESESILGQTGSVYFFLFLCVALQYTIAFAWPEFFLITYCKFRFESFQVPMSKRVKEKLRQQESSQIQSKQTKKNKYKTIQKKAGGRKK